MRRFKFIIFVLVTIILFSFVFTACDISQVDSEQLFGESMFVRIEVGPAWYVYYHKTTKVMYIRGVHSDNFTILVNPDGTPQLWNGE